MRGKFDLLDGTAAAVMALAGVFVLTFLWQAAAGFAASERGYLERIRLKSEKRIKKEQTQIASLLDLAASGAGERAWEEGLAAAARLEGNSQLHLFLARGYREREELGAAIAQYRRAVEANRDYTDSRSSYYIGKTLKEVVREGRALFLVRGRPTAEHGGTVRDLFYLERALAGGCH